MVSIVQPSLQILEEKQIILIIVVRYIKLMSRLTKRYLRHVEDSSANAATREHLDNLKRDVTNALKR